MSSHASIPAGLEPSRSAVPPLRGNPTAGLLGATLGFFVGFAAVALFGPTAHRFKEVMELSPAEVGLLVAVPSLSGSLLRIPFSAWVDTTGGRKPFLILLGLSALGMTGLFLVVRLLYPGRLDAGLYPLLLALGVLVGCGIAVFSVGISQVSYWFPQIRQGRALGTYAGVGNLAPGIFSLLLPLALSGWGLATSYMVWLAFLLVGLGLYYLFGRNAWYFQLRDKGLAPGQARTAAGKLGQELFPAGSPRQSLAISARLWKTWALVVLYFTSFGGFIALTAWFPTYWRSYLGAGAVAAGALTALFSLLTSIIRVPGGSVSDRLGGERTAVLALATTALGAVLLTLSTGYALSVAGVVIMALGMGVNNAAVFKLVPQEVPQAVGGAAGWVGGLGAFGGFAIPPLMGLFVDAQGKTGYARGFVILVGLAAVSLGVALTLRHSRQPDRTARRLEETTR
ncbi:MAG: MFS transporter [Actinobacteria bacterium]|nr:MFS transporter [Actinomycetota bacterium]